MPILFVHTLRAATPQALTLEALTPAETTQR